MVRLVAVDTRTSDFIDKNTVQIPLFDNEEAFLSALRKQLLTHYDALLSDAEPDGTIASMLYALHHGMSSPNYKCFRVPLTKESIDVFAANKYHTVLAADWFPFYGTDTSAFDNVILLNPSYSKLFPNTSVSELFLKALGDHNGFMRDLTAVAIISTETVTSTNSILTGTINAYSDLFSALKNHVYEGTLNRSNILKSVFKDVVMYFRAPYLLQGEEGVQRLVSTILKHPPFTYYDIFNFTHHPAVKYLRRTGHQVGSQLKDELELFRNEHKEHGNVYIYEPEHKNPGFTQALTETLCAKHLGKIILLKKTVGEQTKYSACQRGLLINLGEVLEELGAGGGHSNSAGALVTDGELFEKQFVDAVEKEVS